MRDGQQIAKVTKTMLGFEDHGIFTAYVTLDYGGAAQSAGGFAFGGEFTDRWLRGVIGAFGVSRWEDIPGRTIYALIEDGLVVGLEPLPFERGETFVFATARQEQGPHA
jgi:hypothetical protein